MRPSLQPGSDLQLPDDGMMVIISVRESIGLWSQRRRRQRRLRRLLFYYSSHRKQGGNWKSTPAGIWHSIKIRLVCMESIRTPISDSFLSPPPTRYSISWAVESSRLLYARWRLSLPSSSRSIANWAVLPRKKSLEKENKIIKIITTLGQLRDVCRRMPHLPTLLSLPGRTTAPFDY